MSSSTRDQEEAVYSELSIARGQPPSLVFGRNLKAGRDMGKPSGGSRVTPGVP